MHVPTHFLIRSEFANRIEGNTYQDYFFKVIIVSFCCLPYNLCRYLDYKMWMCAVYAFSVSISDLFKS